MMGLAGRGVLVSGGTSGIGLAAAQRFLEEGCRVYITGHEPDALAAALEKLGKRGEISGQVCDVSDHQQAIAAVEAADAAVGALTVVANNAGISWREPFLQLEVAHWDRIMAVNLRGMFSVAQAAAQLLVRAGRAGSIINMASTNALGGEEDYAHYNSSKGGVLQLTRSMAVELGPYGIRVNAICPGYIDTPLNQTIAGGLPGDFAQRYANERIPLRRVGNPEDVAAAYAFLASDDAAFVHGAVLAVDGGQVAVM
ncbi:SDR family oxidoreductase [Fodinicola feengrottensis]|uniref:SDR family oxidoreductase n=1 Tax=Fodinicola feengrottensis TaxID=435914 RepID=A0ABP4S556_9ACTN